MVEWLAWLLPASPYANATEQALDLKSFDSFARQTR